MQSLMSKSKLLHTLEHEYFAIYIFFCGFGGGVFSYQNRENVYAKIRDTKYDIVDEESLKNNLNLYRENFFNSTMQK